MGSCSGSHPIAYWASHGMSDPTIAIANGQAARDKFVLRRSLRQARRRRRTPTAASTIRAARPAIR